jgi:hypothetical protein
VRSIGEGVLEARINYGRGYRVYFGLDGMDLVVLVLCGDKRTQDDDIAFAKALWTEYRVRKAVLSSKPGNRKQESLLQPWENEDGTNT